MTPFEALEKLKQNNVDNSHLFDDKLFEIIETSLKESEYYKMLCNAYVYFIHDDKHKYPVLELGKIIKALEIIKRFRKDKYSKFEIAGNDIIIDVYLTLDDDEIEILKEVL